VPSREYGIRKGHSTLWFFSNAMGIHITDHPEGGSATVPCWASKSEYVAWYHARWPETFLSVFRRTLVCATLIRRNKRESVEYTYREI
jgi:hypothetical protein